MTDKQVTTERNACHSFNLNSHRTMQMSEHGNFTALHMYEKMTPPTILSVCKEATLYILTDFFS